jgi:trk system potassium uptake protein TrkH
MKKNKLLNSPLMLPILFFGAVILIGAVLLHGAEKNRIAALSWTDAVFTATSATCVTGLTVVDTGEYFTTFGQTVILCMMQLGGLGILTFASLSVYLWRRRVSITDRIAVGQSLLHDASFNLGKFLIRLAIWTFSVELAGALLLFARAPASFTPFSAVFHSISAFCNAGFSLFPNSLAEWSEDLAINLIFICLIFFGGIGFSVVIEVQSYIARILRREPRKPGSGLSWYARVVLQTSLALVLIGWVAIYLSEFVGYHRMMGTEDAILTALFQSVTCRTAGFNTLEISNMTNVSLVIMLFLMFVGGSPGSCAGGVKVTTLRVLSALTFSQLKGRSQVVIKKVAVSEDAVKKALVLFLIAASIIFIAIFLLDFTEGGDKPHDQVRGQFLEIVFEAVSAFGTVGLSTGLTPKLSTPGRWIIIFLMFIGRLGPLIFIAVLQRFQKPHFYRLPEEHPMIG